MKHYFKKIILFYLIFAVQTFYCPPLLFDSRYSMIKIAPGATFAIDQPIAVYDGSLVRQAGGTITGSQISFLDGIFEDAGNFLYLSGILNPSGALLLPGNSFIRALPGTILQSVSIGAKNNIISGSPTFNGAISLVDSLSTVTFSLQNPVNTNIALNNGQVYLLGDLKFSDGFMLTGTGTVFGLGYKVETGSSSPLILSNNLTWQNGSNVVLWAYTTDLRGSFTFNGTTSINGNGNILDLANGGRITVGSNSILTISDVELAGLGAGVGSLILTNSSSEVNFSNVTIEMVNNIATNVGTWRFQGPGTITVKNFIWTFSGTSNVIVDGVTLWKDPAGAAAAAGDIVFGSVATNRTYLNSGVISYVGTTTSSSGDDSSLQSQINVLGTSTQSLSTLQQSCCNILQSQVSVLGTSTQFLQSEIDALTQGDGSIQSQIDALGTSTQSLYNLEQSCCNALQSQVNVLGTATQSLQNRDNNLQSQIDLLGTRTFILQSQVSVLGSSTLFLQSEIDALTQRDGLLQSQIDVLGTSTQSLSNLQQSCCNILQSQVSVLGTSTQFLQSEIDALTQGDGSIQSQIDALGTSTQNLYNLEQSCCNALQSQVNVLGTATQSLQNRDNNLQSQIDLLGTRTFILQSQVSVLGSSTLFLQSEIDALTQRDGLLQSQIDVLGTSTQSLSNLQQSCCNILQSQVNVLGTSTQFLQSEIDALGTSTQNLYNLEQSCCNALQSQVNVLGTATQSLQNRDNNLQSQIDLLGTRTFILQSQVSVLGSSTLFLQSEIDALTQRDGLLQSQIDVLGTSTQSLSNLQQSCCNILQSQVNVLGTSTQFLQSEIDALTQGDGSIQSQIDALGTSTQDLYNLEQSCCNALQSQVNVLGTATQSLQIRDNSLQSQIDLLGTRTFILQSQVSVLGSSTLFLQSEIDALTQRDGLLQSQIDVLGTSSQSLSNLQQSCCNTLQSQVNVLGTSTQFLQSEIDALTQIDGSLQSQIDVLGTSTQNLYNLEQSCCNALQSQIDMLQTLTGLVSLTEFLIYLGDQFSSSIVFIESKIEFLLTFTNLGSIIEQIDSLSDVLQEQVSSNEVLVSVVDTSLHGLQSQIDNLGTSTQNIYTLQQSCCNTLQSQVNVLGTSTQFLQSEIDALTQSDGSIQSQIDALGTSSQSLYNLEQSCCNILQSQVNVLGTSTQFLQSEIDALTQSDGSLQSQIDALGTSTQNLYNLEQSCCNALQSQVNVLGTATQSLQIRDNSLQSQMDLLGTRTFILQSQVSVLGSSTLFLQSEIDALTQRDGLLQSQIDILGTSTQSLSNLQQSCCNTLQSQVNVLGTSTQFLQSEIDALTQGDGSIQSQIDALGTSTQDLYNLEQSCCNALQSQVNVLGTATQSLQIRDNSLQSQIDLLGTRTFILQSQVSVLGSSTLFLQSEIDALTQRDGLLQSQIDVLGTSSQSLSNLQQSCCNTLQSQVNVLGTSTQFLQSEIDALTQSDGSIQSQIDALGTSTQNLYNLEQSCCNALQSQVNVLGTSTQFLESMIDNISTNTNVNFSVIQSQIDVLGTSTQYIYNLQQSCCNALQSQIDTVSTITVSANILSRIDKLEVITGSCCTIVVTDTLYFTLNMVPTPTCGCCSVTRFLFDPCYITNNNIPRLIFDPTVYGNGGRINLNKNTRMVFTGEGIVELRDGVVFDFDGTAFDENRTDWPTIEVENRAQMQVNTDATVIFGGNRGTCGPTTCTSGAGGLILSAGGSVLMNNQNSHMIFGEIPQNQIFFKAFFGSLFIVDNPTALVSFQLATFDLEFSDASALSLLSGTFELNTLNGAFAPGNIRSILLKESSSIQIQKLGTTSALLRLSPNVTTDPDNLLGTSVNFNNETGIVYGDGDIQYIAYDFAGTTTLVNTTLQIKNNAFNIEQPMVEAFMELTYIQETGLSESPDRTILVQIGTLPNVLNDGQLAALCPARDGSIVGLSQGDHDVYYDTDTAGGTLDLIRGYDALGNLFTITNCDALTRTPPAPVF